MKTIEVENLEFRYKGQNRNALNGINFQQREGEVVGLMGPTGAGKSTLCRCLNSLIPNFHRGDLKGEIKIFGREIEGKKVYELAREVGLVFQDFESQLFSTTVELEVAFGPENFSLPWEEMRDRIRESLAAVGLTEMENRQPSTLSGGEKQRLAIASVLSLKPQLILMDEPTTDLDPQGKTQIFSIAKHLGKEGATLLIVEHETEELLAMDRILILRNGKLELQGSPSEVFGEVEKLENFGIRPLQVTKFFKEIGETDLPLRVTEAYLLFQQKGWNISQQRYAHLRTQDEHRQQGYGNPIIEATNLEYEYEKGKKTIGGVSLTIREGEFVAIVGQNGSGKTTLVKHFNGLLKPTGGKVFVEGKNTKGQRISDLGRIVGYVFQNPDHQIFADTVKEEILFGPRNYGLPKGEISNRLKKTLEAVDLEGYEEKDPFSLTKGERQRVAVASVLVSGPRVLVLDEPTTGLDYSQQKSMMELLKLLNQMGHTIIIVTHSMWVVAEYTHRVVVLHQGKILLDGTSREVFSNESELARASLRPPEITRLSNRWGRTLRSVEELKFCLERN